jgi:hypothetical protein
MIKREKADKKEIDREGEREEREQKSEMELKFVFLMRRFRGARRVAIQDKLSCGDIILPHACPRDHLNNKA